MTLQSYLRELGGSDPLIQKSEKLQVLATAICPQTITDFFVSEYCKESGERVFESLWFFSEKYMLECKRILSADFNIDVSCVYKSLDRYEITYKEYDPLSPKRTTDASRLGIQGSVADVEFVFRASKGNCTELWRVFDKYMKPNLIEFLDIVERRHR